MTMTATKTWVAGMDSRCDMPSRKASICIPTVGDWADGSAMLAGTFPSFPVALC